MISSPVFSSSPRPKSATSKRSCSSGVMTIPAFRSISSARATAFLYSCAAIIRLPVLGTADFHKPNNLALHCFASRQHDILRPALPQKIMRAQGRMIGCEGLADGLQIGLFQNRSEVDFAHAGLN